MIENSDTPDVEVEARLKKNEQIIEDEEGEDGDLPSEDEDSDLPSGGPDAGYDSNNRFWFVLMMVGGLGVAFAVFSFKKRRINT